MAALWFVVTYNRLVRLRTSVEAEWKQIDVELQRRCGLVPNLVAAVKGAASLEAGVLDAVTRARAGVVAAQSGTPQERSGHEYALSSALKQMAAVAESYPQLTATENYRELQDELANTEDRIAASRSFYNQNVEEYNAARLTMPNRLVAAVLGFREAGYFEMEPGESPERQPVRLARDEPGA